MGWVKHEHSVLTKLPSHVVVKHHCCVRAVGYWIVARVLLHCGRSCRHTGGERLPHKL